MNNNQNTDLKARIYVAAHKSFAMPTRDSLYQPLMVGQSYTELSEGFISDDTGDNISVRNPRYNELTGLYWIWKNSDADVVGLCHYRRFFTTTLGKVRNLLTKKTDILIEREYIDKVLRKYDVILHNKTFFRNGNRNQLCIDPLKSTEENANKLSKELLEIADKTFEMFYPNDVEIYVSVMKRRYAHLLNIMICKKELLNEYCEWLFPLLFAIEQEIDKKHPKEENTRCMGLIAERLLDIWVLKKKLRIKECFTVNTERIDWKMWE